MKYMLDLFAGLGGASEAMIHDRDWETSSDVWKFRWWT